MIGGVVVFVGLKLLIVMLFVNYDEVCFVDVDLFDICWENVSDQFMFGYGLYQCMGKNFVCMEMQIFFEEFMCCLLYMKLVEQCFMYVLNMLFCGFEYLYVEWDLVVNFECCDLLVLCVCMVVCIGELLLYVVSCVVKVQCVLRCVDCVVQVCFVFGDGCMLLCWMFGVYIDVICGDIGIMCQYLLCGDLDECDVYEIVVLYEVQGCGGLVWVYVNLCVGDVLKICGLCNYFCFVIDVGKVIFVVGGIGIMLISVMVCEVKVCGIDYEIYYSGV